MRTFTMTAKTRTQSLLAAAEGTNLRGIFDVTNL